MKKKVLEKDITHLELSSSIILILKNNNILKIEDLWCETKKNLKIMGLNDSQIKEIIIKLELLGFDLNKKIVR